MDILKLEIRGSENVLLSVSVATTLLLWGYTLWTNRGEPEELRAPRSTTLIRSPGTPRTRDAFKRRACACRQVTVRDDCRQNKQNNKWTCSDEEETDTDRNLIPTTMKQRQQMILNR